MAKSLERGIACTLESLVASMEDPGGNISNRPGFSSANCA